MRSSCTTVRAGEKCTDCVSGSPRPCHTGHAGGMIHDAQDPVVLVARRGGVARVQSLHDDGVGRHAIAEAIAAGELVRVRRGWVSEPDADPVLVAAARAGVVVTCISQAARLGLWVHATPDKVHVGADPRAAGGKPERAHVHWAAPVVPRDPDVLVDPIENVLALVASCRPYEQTLATWESALNKRLVTLEALTGYPWKPAARRILTEATPFADAGLETYLRPRLRWLKLPIRTQAWIAGHRVDVLIGDRLVLQIDGGHHVGAQRDEDNRHDAELRLMGYHVICVGYMQMMSAWPTAQDLIMRAVAQGWHLAA